MALKSRQLPPRGNERLLCHVVGIQVRFQTGAHETQERLLMATNQRVEGTRISRARRDDQIGVRIGISKEGG
jgi:hypothetical protein